MTEYVECDIYDIPDGVRFDIPRHLQGQMVTISYGGFGRSEHGRGDPYMSRHDASSGEFQLYRRSDVAPAAPEVRAARQRLEKEQRAKERRAALLAAVLPRLAVKGVADVRREGDDVIATVHGRETRTTLALVREAAEQEYWDIHVYGVCADRTYTDILAVVEEQR